MLRCSLVTIRRVGPVRGRAAAEDECPGPAGLTGAHSEDGALRPVRGCRLDDGRRYDPVAAHSLTCHVLHCEHARQMLAVESSVPATANATDGSLFRRLRDSDTGSAFHGYMEV